MPKPDIHPTWYPDAQGDLQRRKVVMTTGATQPEIHVDVWSGNHPFFTGTQQDPRHRGSCGPLHEEVRHGHQEKKVPTLPRPSPKP